MWSGAAVLAVAAIGAAAMGAGYTAKTALIGRPVPMFALAPAASSRPGVTSSAMHGRPRLINLFASWCAPCIAEAPQIEQIARHGYVVDGVAERDHRDDLDDFLAENGNPYAAIGLDPDGHVQRALGAPGVPQSYVVDSHGTIRYIHVGQIEDEDVGELLWQLDHAR